MSNLHDESRECGAEVAFGSVLLRCFADVFAVQFVVQRFQTDSQLLCCSRFVSVALI